MAKDDHDWRCHFDQETQRYYWMCVHCSKITFKKMN